MRSWAGRLFAGTDNAPWYGLDPATLETLGVETMGGALAGANPLAHTRRDATRNRLVAAAAAFDAFGDTTTTTFWEFDEGGHLISKVEDTDRSFVVHDYAITDEHYVLPISPIAFDLDNIPDFAVRVRRPMRAFNPCRGDSPLTARSRAAGPRAGDGPLRLRRDAARRAQARVAHGRRDN